MDSNLKDPRKLYILYYLDQNYDDVTHYIIGYSYCADKLIEKKAELLKIVSDEKEKYSNLKAQADEKWKQYYQENLAFWERNKLAIKNPNRPDGLWQAEIVIKPAKYSFRASGCSFGSEEDYKDVKGLINLSETDILNIRNVTAKSLASNVVYGRSNGLGEFKPFHYIDWSLITEPISIWVPHEEYQNFKFSGIQYQAGSFFIEEINEI